jgi:Protein of unknown function (DUF3572)
VAVEKSRRVGEQALAERRGQAEALAIRALVFLADERERLGRFLTLSGIAVSELRRAAAEPGFLAGVLEHIRSDEALLVAFAAQMKIDPRDVAGAEMVLAEAGLAGNPI